MGIKVTHRVKNSNNDTVGFIANNNFINLGLVKANIASIDNLRLLKSGTLRASRELPVIYYRDLMKAEYKRLYSESPFKRDIEDKLGAWRKSGDITVLQINGPRQCGKTTELKKFAYKNYEYIIYIDLSDTTGETFKDAVKAKTKATDLLAVMDLLQAHCIKANLPEFENSKKTILIIDEIQLDPSIYNIIRALRNSYNIDIIVSGSYLGITVFNKDFFLPVGTIEEIHLLPLSFREFTRIFNKDKLLNTISISGESDKRDYETLDKLYEIYRQIGGYPDSIKAYIKSKDVRQSLAVIEKILSIFTRESRNYFNTDKHDIIFKHIYKAAFMQMCSDKRGNGTKLVDDVTKIIKQGNKMLVSRDEVSKSLLWIIYSKVIEQCDLFVDGNATDILPARRLYFLDCGIANYIGSMTAIDKTSIEGVLTEIFAYSELYRLYINTSLFGKVKGENPGFSTLGSYELDFMILGTDEKIYGIEVKTKDGTTKSLDEYIKRKLIDRGIVAKKTMGTAGDGFKRSIPIWAIGARFPYN